MQTPTKEHIMRIFTERFFALIVAASISSLVLSPTFA